MNYFTHVLYFQYGRVKTDVSRNILMKFKIYISYYPFFQLLSRRREDKYMLSLFEPKSVKFVDCLSIDNFEK